MKKNIILQPLLVFILFLTGFSVYAQPSNVWAQKANYWSSVTQPVAFSIGTKGYVGTGSGNNSFWEYNPATDVWTQKANYGGGGRSGAIGMSIGTKGYIGLGFNGSYNTNDFWEYDPGTNVWTQKANYPSGGNNAVGFSIGTKGYFCVAAGGNGFYEYDPGTDTWTQKANYPGSANAGGSTGFSIGTKGYIGLGLNGCCTRVSDFWEYDPGTNIWTQKANFGGTSRYNTNGFSIDTKGYVVCGDDVAGGGYTNTFWEYTPSTNTWAQKANFGGGTRALGAALSIGTKGYFGLGYNGSSTYYDFWEYIPTCNIVPSISSTSNVTCNGGSNGSVTVTTTGGTGALSYSWSPSGGTTSVGTNLPAGTFTCTVSDANACVATKTVTITQPPVITASISFSSSVSCNGGNTGAATVSASGGTGSFTSSWSPSGGSTASATSLTSGIYTCTVMDANACVKTSTVNITQPGLITYSVSSITDLVCNGIATGAASISASGGTGTLTYSWTPSGGTNSSASNLLAGTYTCTITDGNACVKTPTLTINQPSAITSFVSSQSNVSGCFGDNNGSATISASGGTGALTYSWSPSGGTATTANNLIAGNYSCTITDASGCVKTQTLVIAQPAAITSSISSQTNIDCNGNNNGSITVAASGGTGSLVYSWAPSGGTSATENNLAAGTYTCTIKDGNNCTKIQTAVITQPPAISSSITAQTNVSCNGGNNGSVSVFASGGTGVLTYSWSPSGATTASVNNLTAGAYICTITDANNCTKNQSVSITQPNVITTSILGQSNVSGCFGQSNGSATILAGGGTGTLNYLWVPSGGSSASATNLSANTYTCYVTDANSCTKTQIVTISQPPAIASSVSFQSDVTGCYGQSTGAAGISASGGTGTLTYSWSPVGGTSSTGINLAAGTYTCTITDANTCTKTQTVSIAQPAPLTSSISSQNNVNGCNGQTNGDATVLASGGTGTLNYNWVPSGGTAATASNLGAGSYTCTITDANSCTKTQTVTITQPSAITASISSQNNVSGCYGQSNGAASVSASGGTGVLSYSWSPSGGTAATGSNLTAGTYTCTITDANNCSTTQTVTINQPPAITSTITTQTNLSCHGGNNGSVSVSASGGTGSLNYVWAPSGSTLTSISNLVAGTYTCTITDLNNCTKAQLVTITQPSAIVPTITSQGNVSCSGGSNGFVILSASGGTGVLNYNWLPSGGTSDTAKNLSVGSYTCTITDANNCSKIQTVNISLSVPATPNICMLTADSLSINNIIYWDKTMYTGVDSFILYRYDAFSTNYLKIGAVSKDSSQFTDIQRNIGGPNGGDPQYSSWQYKLAIKDSCGNVGAKSPYHQSIFVQESFQNFSWNAYVIESGQSNPVTGYAFSRDDSNTGSWHVLVNTSGLSTTDPSYLTYPNGNWRVEA
jgi:large repetitive protein